jgi:hypothetical protein
MNNGEDQGDMPQDRGVRGFAIDPFADARMGLSLFQMRPEDWLVPVREPGPKDAPNTLEDNHE